MRDLPVAYLALQRHDGARMEPAGNRAPARTDPEAAIPAASRPTGPEHGTDRPRTDSAAPWAACFSMLEPLTLLNEKLALVEASLA